MFKLRNIKLQRIFKVLTLLVALIQAANELRRAFRKEPIVYKKFRLK